MWEELEHVVGHSLDRCAMACSGPPCTDTGAEGEGERVPLCTADPSCPTLVFRISTLPEFASTRGMGVTTANIGIFGQ